MCTVENLVLTVVVIGNCTWGWTNDGGCGDDDDDAV